MPVYRTFSYRQPTDRPSHRAACPVLSNRGVRTFLPKGGEATTLSLTGNELIVSLFRDLPGRSLNFLNDFVLIAENTVERARKQ